MTDTPTTSHCDSPRTRETFERVKPGVKCYEVPFADVMGRARLHLLGVYEILVAIVLTVVSTNVVLAVALIIHYQHEHRHQ